MSDVGSPENIMRLAGEVHQQHLLVVLCGVYAYFAATGTTLLEPAQREYTTLSSDEMKTLNTRLKSNLRAGWYMGHTRRWSLSAGKCSEVLREVASVLGWKTAEGQANAA
jgi:hypothetical protein